MFVRSIDDSVTAVFIGRLSMWSVEMDPDNAGTAKIQVCFDSDPFGGDWIDFSTALAAGEILTNPSDTPAGQLNASFPPWIRVADVTGSGNVAIITGH